MIKFGTPIQEDKIKFRSTVQEDNDKSPGTLFLEDKNKS